MQGLHDSIKAFTRRMLGMRLDGLTPAHAFVVRWLRVIIVAFQGYFRDGCTLRASALTYYSLLSIVPVLAMAFGIAKGFGLQRLIENYVVETARAGNWPKEVMNYILTFSHSFLKQTRGGLIAGAGFVLLFWSVLSILEEVEQSFNHIWDVRRARTFFRKITDYLAVIVFTPIFIILSSSAAVLITGQVSLVIHNIRLLGALGALILFAMKLMPFITMSAMFALTYLIMPNTRVRVRSAVLGGLLGGIIYQAVQFLYLEFQIHLGSYGAIYGSFAAVPLLVAWLQLSWMIVFFGAEIAVAHESHQPFALHPDPSTVSIASMKLLVLKILHLVMKRFAAGEQALTGSEISERLEIPIRLTRRLLDRLVKTGLLVETIDVPGAEPYLRPARSLDDVRIQHAIEAFERVGDHFGVSESGEGGVIDAVFREMSQAAHRAPENITLKEI